MLINKKTYPYIWVFKVVSGEDLICKVVSEDENFYEIEKPLQMGMTQRGLQFAPVSIMLDLDKGIKLAKDKIVFHGAAVEELQTQYESTTSGIVLPQKSSIITG